MKLILTIILTLTIGFTQQILGIEFGKTIQSQRQKLFDAGFKEIEPGSLIGKSVYTGGIFAGEEVDGIVVTHEENDIISAVGVISKKTHLNGCFQAFISYKETLTDIYGEPNLNKVEFTYPYKRGDGYALQAIKAGKGTVMSTWHTNGIDIILNLHGYSSSIGSAVLLYQHKELTDTISRKKEVKSKNDF